MTRPLLTLKPATNPDIELAGALLRCRQCRYQWTAPLDPFLAVEPEHMRCPNCLARSPEPPKAAA